MNRETDGYQNDFGPIGTSDGGELNASRATSLALLAIIALIAAMAIIVLFAPVAYDTDHFGDTLFILSAAWRQFQGLEPAIDFGHFYGGFASWTIAQAIALFGPTIHAFDYALVGLFAAFGLTVILVAWNRMSALGTAIALLVIATLFFTRHPLESAESLTRLLSTHSFLYNRIGLATVVLSGFFVSLPSRSQPAEILSGIAIGGFVLAAALAKPTFIILAPAVLVALAIQTRWTALLSLLGGLVLIATIFDPWGARWLASFHYAMASTGDRADAQLLQLIRKTVQIPLAQPVALTFTTAAVAAVFLRRLCPWRTGVACFLVAGGGLGMSATMGGGGNLGQMALPILAMISIVAAEMARTYGGQLALALQASALILTLGFSIPHAANLLGTTVEAWANRDSILISDGPLASYLSVVEGENVRIGRATQYQMLADGISALEELGDMSTHGIVADNGISFEFALLAKPVRGFPLWPRAVSPELAENRALAPEIDFVLLGKGPQEDLEIGPVLRGKLTDEFNLCVETAYWEIYARVTTASIECRTVLDTDRDNLVTE